MYVFKALYNSNPSSSSCSPVWTEANALALLGHEVVTAVLHVVPALRLVRVRPADQVTACRGSAIRQSVAFWGGDLLWLAFAI